MEGVDISHWNFDFHNSLGYFITNADEYIYARYGGRDARAAESYLSLDSLQIALEAGLLQHELYQQGKLPERTRSEPFYPRDIPQLNQYVVKQRNCVECHHIADYRAQQLELEGKLDKLRTMFPFPDIRNIGIELDVPKGLVVDQATEAVAEAGLQPGDRITGINGVPVITFADLQYEYDKIPRESRHFELEIDRGGSRHVLSVDLPALWWKYDVGFRYWSIDPLIYFDAEPIPADEKQELGLPAESFASRVSEIDPIAPQLGLHQLEVGDVIVGVNGVASDPTLPDARLYLRLNVTPGEPAQLTVLRDGQRSEMKIKTKRQFYRKSIPKTKDKGA